MSPNLAMMSDGKKFLWDGQPYDSKEAAASAAQSYQNDNFQVQTVEEDGKFLVYTRRVIKEWVAATQ
ncbi:MAG: hypothetical protein ABSF85_15950 [Terriglobales bacterium]|jgi:hypothetical protein